MTNRGYNMSNCRLCQSHEGPFLDEEEMKKFNVMNKNGLARFMKIDPDGNPHRICYRCLHESSELLNFMEESVKIWVKYRSSVNELAMVKTEMMSRKRAKQRQEREHYSGVSTASPSTQSSASVTDCDNPKRAKTNAKSNATPKTETISRKRSKKEQDEQDSGVSAASSSTQSPASVTDCDNPKRAKINAESTATPKTEITSRKISKKEQDEQDSGLATASPSTQSPASVTDCGNPERAETNAKSNETPKTEIISRKISEKEQDEQDSSVPTASPSTQFPASATDCDNPKRAETNAKSNETPKTEIISRKIFEKGQDEQDSGVSTASPSTQSPASVTDCANPERAETNAKSNETPKTEIISWKNSEKEQDEQDSGVSTASPSTQPPGSVTDGDNPETAEANAKSNETPKTEIISIEISEKEQDEQDSGVSTASPSTQSSASVTDCDNPERAETNAKSNETPKTEIISKKIAEKEQDVQDSGLATVSPSTQSPASVTDCDNPERAETERTDQDRHDKKALKCNNKIQTVPVSQFGSFVHLCNVCKSVFPEATKVHFCPKKQQPTKEFLTTITSAILEKMPSTEELLYGKTYQS